MTDRNLWNGQGEPRTGQWVNIQANRYCGNGVVIGTDRDITGYDELLYVVEVLDADGNRTDIVEGMIEQLAVVDDPTDDEQLALRPPLDPNDPYVSLLMVQGFDRAPGPASLPSDPF